MNNLKSLTTELRNLTTEFNELVKKDDFDAYQAFGYKCIDFVDSIDVKNFPTSENRAFLKDLLSLLLNLVDKLRSYSEYLISNKKAEPESKPVDDTANITSATNDIKDDLEGVGMTNSNAKALVLSNGTGNVSGHPLSDDYKAA